MTKRELLQMALDALNMAIDWIDPNEVVQLDISDVIQTLRAELEKPEPEPVGYFIDYGREQWVEHDLKQLADDDKDCLTSIPLYRKEDL